MKKNIIFEFLQERQVVWSAINQTDYSIFGERGKIFLTEEIMDHLKIENGDEVTIETVRRK